MATNARRADPQIDPTPPAIDDSLSFASLCWQKSNKEIHEWWTAETLIGTYAICHDKGWHAMLNDGMAWEAELDHHPEYHFGLAAAKAACQRHFEEKVGSVVQVKPSSRDMDVYQARVARWIAACFNEDVLMDTTERSHRFGEEALELLQAAGVPKEDMIQLLDYVYSRPPGTVPEEIGGTATTFFALCVAHKHSFAVEALAEMDRIEVPEKMAAIHAKWLGKPKIGPLPGPSEPAASR